MVSKNLKTFIYYGNEYVILKSHSCNQLMIAMITIDSDLDNYLLFCEDFHPWNSSSCEFRAIKKDVFDPNLGIKYYLNQIENLLSLEVHDAVLNW